MRKCCLVVLDVLDLSWSLSSSMASASAFSLVDPFVSHSISSSAFDFAIFMDPTCFESSSAIVALSLLRVSSGAWSRAS